MDRLQRGSGFALLFLLAIAVSAGAATAPGVQLSDVTVATQPDSVTVFVKTSSTPKYEAQLIDTPSRLVLDFAGTTYAWRKTPLAVGQDPLKQIRGSQYRKGVARVVVELTRKVGYAIREEENGLAIVIPTVRLAQAATTPDVPAMVPTPAPAVKRTPAPVRIAQAPVAPVAPTTPAVTAPAAPESRLISLDFKDADVVNLLRILAAESTRNIVVGEDVKGKMSITLRNVPWELALDTILESRGLVKIEKDGVLRIVSADQLAKEREAQARVEEAKVKAETDIRTKQAEASLKEQAAHLAKAAADAALAEQRARGPLREEAIRLSYADPGDVASTLQGLLGIGSGTIAPCRTENEQGVGSTTGGGGVTAAGAPLIAEPPFAQLYGSQVTQQQQAAATPPPPTPGSSETVAKGLAIRTYCSTNTLFLRLYEADLQRIKKLIVESLDVPLPQVKIEARMEILSRQDLFAIGVQWGGGGIVNASRNSTIVGRGFTSDQLQGGIPAGSIPPPPNPNFNPAAPTSEILPISAITGLPAGGNLVNLPIGALLQGAAAAGTGGLAFGIVGSRLNLNLALEALKTEGKTRTLARPEVVTVENKKASMSLGEEIPYATVSSAGTQIQFKEALLRLDVTPTVIREGDINRIKMFVVVENNSRGTTTINLGSAGSPPVIVRRRAATNVLVKEGERLVIGGVTNNETQTETRKIPLLGDIPILGWLFKQHGEQNSGTELVVFITPSIVRRDAPSASVPGVPTAKR